MAAAVDCSISKIADPSRLLGGTGAASGLSGEQGVWGMDLRRLRGAAVAWADHAASRIKQQAVVRER